MASQREDAAPMTFWAAFRCLIVFQLKLALDALRDFLFSPLSIVAFLLDAALQPNESVSYTRRLKDMGQRSDRVINLFDEYSGKGHYTVDETFGEVESAVKASPRAGQKDDERL